MNDIQVLRGPPDPSDPALTHLSAIVHLGPAHVRPPHSTSQVHLLILSKVIRNAQDSQSYIHHRATRDDGAVSLILEMLNVPISRSGKKETAAINLTTMNTERLDGKLTEIAFVGYDVPFSPNASPGHRNPRRRHSNQRRRVVCNRQRRRMVSNRVDVVLPPKYTSELVHALHNEREMARTEFLKTKVLRCQCADYYAQAEAAEREAKADAKYSKYVNEMAVQIGLRMSMEGNTA